LGASWEAFALDQVLHALRPPEAYFWATHNGTELDLRFTHRGRRYGVEFKLHEAPGAGLGLLILAQDQQDGSACASGMPSCGTDDGWSAGSTAGVITAIGSGVAVGEEGHASARGVRLAVHVPSSHQERRGLHGDHRRTALCRPPLV